MKKISVGIIILNWNGFEDTQLLLSSIQKLQTTYDYTIYVIDNASTDGSKEKLSTNKSIRLIPLAENRGFTGANNQGIEQAIHDGVDYCWILNNDTIVDPKALDALIHPFEQEKVYGSGQRSARYEIIKENACQKYF